MKTLPTFDEESLLWGKGFMHVAGFDEVGRGAFAGPLVTAAVVFPKDCIFTDLDLLKINDSKLLSARSRELLSEKIKLIAENYSISTVPISYINRFGVGKAAQNGFFESFNNLRIKPDFCLIDAFYIENLNKNIQKPIIHGDKLSISIAAASILAKVYRDELMRKLHTITPQYNFYENKGYGTKFHREQIKKSGLSPYHRLSFNLSAYLA